MPTTVIMASSVVVKANAAVCSSVSIGCAADGARSTVMYAVSNEEPHDLDPSKVAMIL